MLKGSGPIKDLVAGAPIPGSSSRWQDAPGTNRQIHENGPLTIALANDRAVLVSLPSAGLGVFGDAEKRVTSSNVADHRAGPAALVRNAESVPCGDIADQAERAEEMIEKLGRLTARSTAANGCRAADPWSESQPACESQPRG